MKVLQVFNQQRSERGGEEKAVRATNESLRDSGIEVLLHMVSSRGISDTVAAKVKAAASGIYSFSSYRAVRQLIDDWQPNIVHVHNFYPFLSPSVFVACTDSGVPVVYRPASQILTCPTWYHFYDGAICERCMGGKEYWCVLKNCRDNIFESTAYAARSAFARSFDLFNKHVTVFIAQSAFMKQRLESYGIAEHRISVIPNMIHVADRTNGVSRSYVAFAGRLSPEKGVPVLLEAARSLPSTRFLIAGDGPLRDSLQSIAPPNVEFLGLVGSEGLHQLYRGARMVVIPSIAYETAPNVALEAMAHGTPVVASRIGALPEVVIDEVTGRLFEPGNHAQLAQSVDVLWSNPERAIQLGEKGRDLVRTNHTEHQFVSRTLAAYRSALELNSHRAI